MIKSMTGYGTGQKATKKLSLEVTLRTVNGRFLDLRWHMPKEYIALESELKKIISQRIKRGRVDIYINRKLGASATLGLVSVQQAMAHEWSKAYAELAKASRLENNLDLKTLAAQSGVLHLSEETGLSESEKKQLVACLKQAVKACDEERSREGLALQRELRSLVNNLLELIKNMSSQSEKAADGLQQKLMNRLVQKDLEVEVDEQRVAQEVAIYLDRADIREELTRLEEHLKQYQQLLGRGEQGKKLDFYCQELLREVNTVGSKSQSSKLTQLVVDAKSIIEKIREQVQNVE